MRVWGGCGGDPWLWNVVVCCIYVCTGGRFGNLGRTMVGRGEGENCTEEEIKRNKGGEKHIISHTLQRHTRLHLLLKSRTNKRTLRVWHIYIYIKLWARGPWPIGLGSLRMTKKRHILRHKLLLTLQDGHKWEFLRFDNMGSPTHSLTHSLVVTLVVSCETYKSYACGPNAMRPLDPCPPSSTNPQPILSRTRAKPRELSQGFVCAFRPFQKTKKMCSTSKP